MAGQKWAISKSPEFTKFLTRKSSPEESKLDKLFANDKVQRFSSNMYVVVPSLDCPVGRSSFTTIHKGFPCTKQASETT